jgi:hypothetical protein
MRLADGLRFAVACSVVFLSTTAAAATSQLLNGFTQGTETSEQVRQGETDDGVRFLVNAPAPFDPQRPTLLVIYALPNGNTIEQTIGCRPAHGLDWNFGIQHIGAQVRRLREVDRARNVAVAYVEADGLSWPAWRQKRPENPRLIRELVDALAGHFPREKLTIALAAHSGGGSFVFGYLNAAETIPAAVECIALIDANYGYSDDDRHGDKLLAWLRGGVARRLTVIAYDDREVKLDGKPIVGPAGGTYQASHRMIERFRQDGLVSERTHGPLTRFEAADGRAPFIVHANPEQKILHTRLVEQNGLLEGLAAGTPLAGRWGGEFWGPRSYDALIQPLPSIPWRRKDAPTGAAFVRRVSMMPLAEREKAFEREIARGNFPSYLRNLRPVRVTADVDGRRRECVFEVAGDYLAVGGDDDFVRMPLTPAAAVRVAASLGCSLPTRKMVDAIYAQADLRFEPRPLTEDRESVETFARHDRIIRSQLTGAKPGLVAGVKKDVVLSNRLAEKPGRVAIYGWHRSDGTPIQPLTTVHHGAYVDYSHGVRLVRRVVRVDGKEMMIEDVLKDRVLSVLLSDEGPMNDAAFYNDGHPPTTRPTSAP